MRYITGIAATSHLDSHNEKLSLRALEQLVEQTNAQYIPLGVDHDPRVSPIGRSISAELISLPDGEFAVRTVSQLFEPGDVIPYVDDGRDMPVHPVGAGRLEIESDRSYAASEDQELLEELAHLLDAELKEAQKKALVPVSVLTFVAGVTLGSFAKGFFEKAGADTWDVVKEKVSKLLERRMKRETEYLVRFVFDVHEDERTLSVETILANPSADDIHQFMQEGLELLQLMAPEYFTSHPDLVRVVHEYEDGRVKLAYGVRKDAVPLYPGPDLVSRLQALG